MIKTVFRIILTVIKFAIRAIVENPLVTIMIVLQMLILTRGMHMNVGTIKQVIIQYCAAPAIIARQAGTVDVNRNNIYTAAPAKVTQLPPSGGK